jgi:hypothetical protein
VFGKPMNEAWNDWIAWEHEFQAANLASVRKFPPTSGQRITTVPLGSVSRSFIDPKHNELLGAFMYPGKVRTSGAVSLSDGRPAQLRRRQGDR